MAIFKPVGASTHDGEVKLQRSNWNAEQTRLIKSGLLHSDQNATQHVYRQPLTSHLGQA